MKSRAITRRCHPQVNQPMGSRSRFGYAPANTR
jgi:hypothetical protein